MEGGERGEWTEREGGGEEAGLRHGEEGRGAERGDAEKDHGEWIEEWREE